MEKGWCPEYEGASLTCDEDAVGNNVSAQAFVVQSWRIEAKPT